MPAQEKQIHYPEPSPDGILRGQDGRALHDWNSGEVLRSTARERPKVTGRDGRVLPDPCGNR